MDVNKAKELAVTLQKVFVLGDKAKLSKEDIEYLKQVKAVLIEHLNEVHEYRADLTNKKEKIIEILNRHNKA